MKRAYTHTKYYLNDSGLSLANDDEIKMYIPLQAVAMAQITSLEAIGTVHYQARAAGLERSYESYDVT